MADLVVQRADGYYLQNYVDVRVLQEREGKADRYVWRKHWADFAGPLPADDPQITARLAPKPVKYKPFDYYTVCNMPRYTKRVGLKKDKNDTWNKTRLVS